MPSFINLPTINLIVMQNTFNLFLFFAFFLTLSALILGSCGNTKTKKIKRDAPDKEWIVLFDGSNTDAWKGFKKDSLPAGWDIHNGFFITTSLIKRYPCHSEI